MNEKRNKSKDQIEKRSDKKCIYISKEIFCFFVTFIYLIPVLSLSQVVIDYFIIVFIDCCSVKVIIARVELRIIFS